MEIGDVNILLWFYTNLGYHWLASPHKRVRIRSSWPTPSAMELPPAWKTRTFSWNFVFLLACRYDLLSFRPIDNLRSNLVDPTRTRGRLHCWDPTVYTIRDVVIIVSIVEKNETAAKSDAWEKGRCGEPHRHFPHQNYFSWSMFSTITGNHRSNVTTYLFLN